MNKEKHPKYLKKAFYFLSISLVLAYLQMELRFDVLIHSPSHHIIKDSKEWGDEVNLIPEDFAYGESKESIFKQMALAGYSTLPQDSSNTKENKSTLGSNVIFTREANTLICNITLYVFLNFSDQGNLISAHGTRQEKGCL